MTDKELERFAQFQEENRRKGWQVSPTPEEIRARKTQAGA